MKWEIFDQDGWIKKEGGIPLPFPSPLYLSVNFHLNLYAKAKNRLKIWSKCLQKCQILFNNGHFCTNMREIGLFDVAEGNFSGKLELFKKNVWMDCLFWVMEGWIWFFWMDGWMDQNFSKIWMDGSKRRGGIPSPFPSPLYHCIIIIVVVVCFLLSL